MPDEPVVIEWHNPMYAAGHGCMRAVSGEASPDGRLLKWTVEGCAKDATGRDAWHRVGLNPTNEASIFNGLLAALGRGGVTVGKDAPEPAKWWERHSSRCGIDARGCVPECPKDQVERALDQARAEAHREGRCAVADRVWRVIRELAEWDDYGENFNAQEWVDKLTRAVGV